MRALHPDNLTWAALLGRWVQFAQASLSLPADAEGERWRASVPCVINLQAVTFALGDLSELPPDELALGRDRAAVLIDENAAKLGSIWQGQSIPESLIEIERDARAALLLTGLAE
jgi:hypothetical protein